jgi:hypothetical protein
VTDVNGDQLETSVEGFFANSTEALWLSAVRRKRVSQEGGRL